MSTATALTSAWASAARARTSAHTDEAAIAATAITAGHEPGGDASRRGAGSARGCAAPRSPAARSARAACRAPTRSARITKLPVPLTVRAGDAVAGALLDRHRLAGDHRLVDGARVPRGRRRRPAPSRRAARADASPTCTSRERDVALRAVRRRRGARSSGRGRAARGSRRRSRCARAARAPGRAARASMITAAASK